MGKRTTSGELDKIVKRLGIGIRANGKGSIGLKASDTGTEHDMELPAGNELEGAKSLQTSYAGKVCVSIKFYRHRLADYGEECSRAISEKSLIDCLQYSGLIRGDSSKEIRVKDLGQQKVDKKQDERTEITIEYPEFDFDNPWVATGRTDGR